MKGQKPGRVISRHRSGCSGAPEAKNTAPAPAPSKSIGGYGKTKVASGRMRSAKGPGTPCPGQKVTARGYGKTGHGSPKKRTSGGPSRSGDRYTQGGTSSPSSKRGPSGLGRSGTNYPPKG